MGGLTNRQQYRLYLKHSEDWDLLRKMALGRVQMKCQGCEKVDHRNDAHHIRYHPKGWKFNRLNQLRVLCRDCHVEIHKLTSPKDYKTGSQALKEYKRAINLIRRSHGRIPFAHSKDTTNRECYQFPSTGCDCRKCQEFRNRPKSAALALLSITADFC